MKTSNVNILVSTTLVTFLVGCGAFDDLLPKNTETKTVPIEAAKDNGNDESLKTANLKNKSDLPECDTENESSLAYVQEEQEFYICAGTKWLALETKGDHGEKGDQGEKGDKGDKGEEGIAGINGSDGSNGSDGYDGSNGSNGSNGSDGVDGIDNHIAAHWECSIAMSDNPYLTLNETVEYTVDLTTYGDVIAWMRMTNNQLDFTKTRSYPKTHADAATAKVTHKMNIVGGSVNMGLLQVTINQSTDEATVLFTDADQASLGGVYTKTASCSKTTY